MSDRYFTPYIYCFVQSGEAFMVKGNKHTHTHTHTPHTQTHTHRVTNTSFELMMRHLSWLSWYTLAGFLFSRNKEKSLKPLFHNLRQLRNLSSIPFNFFQCISSLSYWNSLPRVLEIGISDISWKTTVSCYYGFIKILIRKIQAIHDIILL